MIVTVIIPVVVFSSMLGFGIQALLNKLGEPARKRASEKFIERSSLRDRLN